ncbi:hypothetical protein DKZ56_13255 [Ureibacillus thermophilus]|uniref:Uncharacterized protein n=2 Tax=Ureibacillus thermophilus TaxID=367743 RepID=A0A4P6UTQ3_9BACL|nr:hypothetical protein DKZ56_13255 [Ureibacillus thermophilus]
MIMNCKLLYYVSPKDNFEADGRIFLKGEKYPVYDVDGDSLLIAENGDFRFTNQLMKQVIEEWELEVTEI